MKTETPAPGRAQGRGQSITADNPASTIAAAPAPTAFDRLERRYGNLLAAHVPAGDTADVTRARLRLLAARDFAASWLAMPEAHASDALWLLSLAAHHAERWVFSGEASHVQRAAQCVAGLVDAARRLDRLDVES